jgi:hypothetical protein
MEAIMFLRTVGWHSRTTRRYIPEDCTLHNHCFENLFIEGGGWEGEEDDDDEVEEEEEEEIIWGCFLVILIVGL